MKNNKVFLFVIPLLNLTLITLLQFSQLSVVLAEPPVDRTETATIKPNANWMPSTGAKTSHFNFQEGEVWLKSDGEWKISGWVRHAGVLCGRYSVGVQFGIGTPNCINVKWQNEPRFSTPKQQCNNAIARHLALYETIDLAKNFEKITCARRIVRCNGSCKGSSGRFTSEP